MDGTRESGLGQWSVGRQHRRDADTVTMLGVRPRTEIINAMRRITMNEGVHPFATCSMDGAPFARTRTVLVPLPAVPSISFL